MLCLLFFGNLSLCIAFANDSFLQKVGTLNEALGRYHSSLRPNERYEVGVRISNALLEVLHEQDSLTNEPQSIIGDGKGFRLTYGDWVNIGDKKIRLVILAPKEINMGATTTVFSQVRVGGTVSMAEKIHSLMMGANIGHLEYFKIIYSGNEYFTVLAEKNNGSRCSRGRLIQSGRCRTLTGRSMGKRQALIAGWDRRQARAPRLILYCMPIQGMRGISVALSQ